MDKAVNTLNPPVRIKRSRDDINEDAMQMYFGELKSLFTTGLQKQDDKFQSLHDAVSDLSTQNSDLKSDLESINSSITEFRSELSLMHAKF